MLLLPLSFAATPADALPRVVARTRARMHGCVVVPPGDNLRMVVECGEEGAFSVPLQGLVDACQGRAAACRRYGNQLVDDLVATRKARELTLDNVVPVVRDDAWADKANSLLAAGGGHGVVLTTPLPEPLVLVWMRDSPEAFRPLTDLDLAALQVDTSAVEAAARTKCAAAFTPPAVSGLTTLDLGDYGGCLLLAPAVARWTVWATPKVAVFDTAETADAALAAARAASPTLPLVAIEAR